MNHTVEDAARPNTPTPTLSSDPPTPTPVAPTVTRTLTLEGRRPLADLFRVDVAPNVRPKVGRTSDEYRKGMDEGQLRQQLADCELMWRYDYSARILTSSGFYAVIYSGPGIRAPVAKALVVERTRRLCAELARDTNKAEARRLRQKLHLVKKELRGFKVLVDTQANNLIQINAQNQKAAAASDSSSATSVSWQPDIHQFAVWLKDDVKEGMGIWADDDPPEDTEESDEPESTGEDSDDDWNMWLMHGDE